MQEGSKARSSGWQCQASSLGLMGPEGGQGLEAPLNWPSTVATLRVLNPLATGQITTHKRGLWDSVLGSRTLYHPQVTGTRAPYQLLLADN